MAIHAVLELSLYLENFRNVDLYHQGLYRIRVQAYAQSKCVFASPKDLVWVNKSIISPNPHNLATPEIIGNYVYTPTFLVRYCDEEVQFSQAACFRIEIKLPDLDCSDNLTLEFELLFSDLGGKVDLEEAAEVAKTNDWAEAVSSVSYQLKFPRIFQPSFLQVVFDDNHCCSLNSTLHYTLLGYKFKHLDESEDSALAKALFKDKDGNPKPFIGAKETDDIYDKLMKVLVRGYERLREHYFVVLSKCVPEKDRQLLNYIPPSLSFPGNPAQVPYVSHKKVSVEALPTFFEKEEAVAEYSKPPKFSLRVASHDPFKVSKTMLRDINSVAGQISQLWLKINELNSKGHKPVLNLLHEKSRIVVRQAYSTTHIRRVLRAKDLGLSVEQNKAENTQRFAARRRQENSGTKICSLAFVDNTELSELPVLLEELCILDTSITNGPVELNGIDSSMLARDRKGKYRGVHLLVLVHGYQGSSNDMRILKNNISLAFPECLFLCSTCNEDNTTDSIAQLGERLAEEVKDYIQEWCPASSLGRLSFIGHSLGGLIIRSALPLLEEYSKKMHLCMTLSTPHLGCSKGSSSIVTAGMWVLKTLKKCRALNEMSLQDSQQIENSYLAALGNQPGLEWFTHLVLVSSPQDYYVPHHSARIEIPPALLRQHPQQRALLPVAQNLLKNRDRLHRIDVDFQLKEKSFSTWIGRAAHIQFLENSSFMKSLVYLHPEFFC